MFQQGETVSVPRKVKRSRYARLPWDVLTDAEISSDAKVVYAVIAGHAFQGTVAYIGQRFIGELAGMSAAKVNRLLKQLVPKYLERDIEASGKRAHYHLKSPVFGQKQRAGVEEVISSPSGNRRLASVRTA